PGDYDDVHEIEYRRVTATGEYLVDAEVIIRGRSKDSAPGSWVLTPLLLDDGDAVMVNRGWIANAGEIEAVPEAVAAPSGRVTVSGLVRPTETRGSFGANDPGGEKLTNLARADIARLDEQVDADLLPLYVQMEAQDPEVLPTDPSPVPAPAPDE